MKKYHPLLLSLLSGVLLFAAWPVSPLTFLISIAFVPLLQLERQTTRRAVFFRWIYLSMLVWNVATTWWVCISTVPGGIAAILANSLLMCIPWLGFYNVKKRMGEKAGYAALILFWLTFEYIHLNWELSWPWLTLGNVFATHPAWVQWYAFTGTSGGTLWIWMVNLAVFLLLRKRQQERESSGPFFSLPVRTLAAMLIIPFLLSYLLLYNKKEVVASSLHQANSSIRQPAKNIVIVQPNIDPYNEKFVAGGQEAQLQKLIRLSESQIDSNTALVVWPETAVPVSINEDEVKSNFFIAPAWFFLKKHPGLNLLTGIEGYRFYNGRNKTTTSFKVPPNENDPHKDTSALYADTYNSAALMDSANIQIYHKSKLVPGVETLPSFLTFMTPLFEKFGGTASGYTKQSERTVLNTYNNSYRVAPAVCYESIYGEFMSKYILNGADLIAVITNDGWWGNTPGYRQHKNYARLRAIETDRWVVRSANTGISCVIDPTGNVIDPRPWDQVAVIKQEVPANKSLTFYVRFGDLISKAAIILTVLLIGWNLVLIIRIKGINKANKNKGNKNKGNNGKGNKKNE
ncbi:apolipoprotein N-acyltransferase [Flavitalea flava]